MQPAQPSRPKVPPSAKVRRQRSGETYASKALVLAQEFSKRERRAPTQRELRQLVGGGSKRDLVAATALLFSQIDKLTGPPEPTSDQEVVSLRAKVATLEAKLLAVEEMRKVEVEQFEGMRKHLMVQTAMIRDQILSGSSTSLGFRQPSQTFVVREIETEPLD